MTFNEDILNGFQVTERKRFCDGQTDRQVEKGTTQKVQIQELCFLRSAYRLMLVYICLKFDEVILNGLQVTERKRFCHGLLFCDGQTDRQVRRGITQKIKTQNYGSCALHVV